MMAERILVTYATRAGSTREVAEFIGKTMQQAGIEVDVKPVKEVHDLSLYQGIILGSPIRIGRLMPEALEFARKHQREFMQMPVAYFVVCMTMAEDTPENRATVEAYLAPLCQIHEPISKGLFAGAVHRERLEPFWRFLLKFVNDGPLTISEARDWDAIRAWTEQIAPALEEQNHA